MTTNLLKQDEPYRTGLSGVASSDCFILVFFADAQIIFDICMTLARNDRKALLLHCIPLWVCSTTLKFGILIVWINLALGRRGSMVRYGTRSLTAGRSMG